MLADLDWYARTSLRQEAVKRGTQTGLNQLSFAFPAGSHPSSIGGLPACFFSPSQSLNSGITSPTQTVNRDYVDQGGSGTTHSALKYGCPTMIIPHIIDQFVWSKNTSDIGVGPHGVKVGKITTKNLEPKILELMNNISFKKKAEQMATVIEKEYFCEEIYKAIIEE